MELTGQLSNADLPGLLRHLHDSAVHTSTAPRVTHAPARIHKVVHRLTPEERSRLANMYAAGSTAQALAAEFGISKASVLNILEADGIPRRRRPLSAAQVERARSLYASGLSLARVGLVMEVDASTVWRAFQRRGVPMRPTSQRSS